MNNILTIKAQTLVRIVDDDQDIRDSLQLMLGFRGWHVACYASAETFLNHDDLSTPGCLVLDVRMPVIGGLELQRILKKRHCALPVIFLTGHGDVEMAVQAMQEGAAHFLQKPVPAQKIEEVIERYTLESYATQENATQATLDWLSEKVTSLSPRERQIVLLTQHLSTRGIADRLGISSKTVENHRISACKKMQTHNTDEILKILLRLEESTPRIAS